MKIPGHLSVKINTLTLTGILAGDTVSAAATGYDFADANAGTDRIVTASGATLSGVDAGNYTLATIAAGAADVAPRLLTVTADDQMRIAGRGNPPLGYTIGDGGLIDGDALTGTPATSANRQSGAGEYLITQGSLDAGPNYRIDFTLGTLFVSARPQSEEPQLPVPGPPASFPDMLSASRLPVVRLSHLLTGQTSPVASWVYDENPQFYTGSLAYSCYGNSTYGYLARVCLPSK